jgi:hypothetical protein
MAARDMDGCSLSTFDPGPRMSNAMSLESLVGQQMSSAGKAFPASSNTG